MLTCRWIYGNEIIDLAISRGWNQYEEHAWALVYEAESGGDPKYTNRVTLSHPFNYLTEEEVEAWEKNMP